MRQRWLRGREQRGKVAPNPVSQTYRPALWTDHLRTALLAGLGGFLLHLAALPLAWMIGAMLATAWLASRRAAAVPQLARPLALVVLGLALGQAFTGPVMQAVAGALPAMFVAGTLSILAGAAAAPLFRAIARTDAKTAYFSAVPGGIMVMAVLAQRAGAQVAPVTIAQTLRMAAVVLTFPPVLAIVAPHADTAAFQAGQVAANFPGLALLLAGGGLAGLVSARLGLVNAAMLAPLLLAMLLSATGQLPSGVPRWLVDIAQVAMGASLGLRLTPEQLGKGPRRLFLAGIASALTIILLLAAMGLCLGWVSGLPPAAVVLGMAPGGMPEMTITAKALDLAVPLVLGFHLVRTVLCNLLVGPIWRGVRAAGLGR